MKKIFYILYGMLLMTGAFTITSCLSDDNDSDDYDGITPEDYTYYMNQMTGDYTGKLFFAGENLNELDSIATTATVTGVGDSCVYVSVPLVNLARGTNDDWLKAAAEEEGGNVTLAIKYYLYTFAGSNAMNGITGNTERVYVRTWWQNALRASGIGLGVLAALCAILMFVTKRERG